METKIIKDAQNTVKLQKDISYAWKELYEQKKYAYEILEAENRELRHRCNELQRTVERLAALGQTN